MGDLHTLAASTGSPHPALLGWLGSVQLTESSSNSIAIQARDVCQERDATPTVLLGEKTGHEPTTALVGTSDQAIDGQVLAGNRPVGLPTT